MFRISGFILTLTFLTLCAGAYASPAESPAVTKKPASAQAKKAAPKRKPARRATRSWRRRGQQSIEASRVREIQEALIRENYLDGKADGIWGSGTKEALVRYQADNGWQSKVVPDSRALIQLGLGPDRSAVINPESLQSSLVSRGAQN